jgi:AcrR family transcriptional regulator
MTPMQQTILAEARKHAARLGYTNIRRDDIARTLGIAAGGVTYHWGHMDKLKNAVVRAAITDSEFPIIAQAITAGHPYAAKIPDDLRRKALLAAATR